MALDLEEQEQVAELKAWWQQHGRLVTAATITAVTRRPCCCHHAFSSATCSCSSRSRAIRLPYWASDSRTAATNPSIGTSRAVLLARCFTCTVFFENSFSPATSARRKPFRSAYVSWLPIFAVSR